MSNILVCTGCQEKFDKRELIEGRDHVLYCGNCFKDVYCAASGDSKSKETSDLREKIIPYPEIFSYNKKRSFIAESCVTSSSSTISLSKKPLQCPKASCSKFVSLFTLESHFRYEHKEIPIVITQVDARSALEFYLKDIPDNVTQCVALFNIIGYDFSTILPQTSQNSTTILQNSNAKPMMVLLATRITNSEISLFDENVTCQITETLDGSNTTLAYEEDNNLTSPLDRIVIWMSSNILTNLNYTVAASTLSNQIRQKYFGPMLLLGDIPMDIFRNGTCLILTHHHLSEMTRSGNEPLALDVVIHSPD
ncbi:uncharacterized protein LOC130900136 isoform X1 [Diorhabda carinulata]|uniref:uncharacterized protein LOC130900136 isoform X1 n=1 Tax=Diorhabda carinulata TaxID=1163345 RepID=UPI0025A2056A|nr:uncharacterized protein LOC130900136 isoform X1 [Diorhabda carinulata]